MSSSGASALTTDTASATPAAAGQAATPDTSKLPEEAQETCNKAMQWAAIAFGGSLLMVGITALLMNYPQAATAFYVIFGLGAAASLIAFIIITVKKNNESAQDPAKPAVAAAAGG